MKHDTAGNIEQVAQTSAQLEENLFHYLSGYGRGRPENLEQVISYPNWQARARAEVERRMTEVVERLDAATLTAIAEGRIDIAQIAERVRETQ